MKPSTRNGTPLVSKEPLRYRVRAKLLYQSRAIPNVVRRYLKQTFPCMCGVKARREASGL
ncbi:MAG: hypothetical protein JW951_06805 [Lentisphaerae bacterium]|nr:hypothetical protein [Lentisphaerota bacterium]